jgi:heptosyltransferase-2
MTDSSYIPDLGPAVPVPVVSLSPDRWRNGVIVRATNWLGDAVMTLPAVYRLRRHLPRGCGLFVLTPRNLASLWRAVDWVDDVVTFPGKRVTRSAAGRVRALNPGVGVVLPNSFGSALDLVRCGVGTRIGRRGNGRSWLLTHRLPAWKHAELSGRHQTAWHLCLAATLGEVPWTADYPPLRGAPPGQVRDKLELISGRHWLAIAPGAAFGPAKQWPVESFTAVCEWWCGRGGGVVGVGTEAERELVAQILDGFGASAVNAAGRTGLDELLTVLGTVDAVLANDSGAMHLAAAAGGRGVAIFGSTDPVATGPVGGTWIVLRDVPECGPCFRRTCPRDDLPYECLRRVSVASVCGALEELCP